MDLVSNKIRRKQLTPGDHIYVWRNGYSYSHHGIYVGEGRVIHVVRGPGLIISSSSSSNNHSGDRVACCTLEEFLSGRDLYRYQYGVGLPHFLTKRGGSCSLAPCGPPQDVLHRASFLLENGFGDYDLFQNNCEDFATYCKTGLLKVNLSTPTRNEQMKFLFAVLFAFIFTPYGMLPTTTSFTCLSLVFCGSYCVFRLISDEGVEKVAVEQFDASHPHPVRIRKGKTSRSLSIVDYIAHAMLGLRLWYWTPENRLLLWFRSYLLWSILTFVLCNHLRRHNKLRLGEHMVYVMWVPAYWYWSSENTFFLCARLWCLTDMSSLLVTDEPRDLKRLQNCMGGTLFVIGLCHWTPESTILQCFRLVFLYQSLSIFGSKHQIYHRLKPLDRLLLVCFVMRLAGLDRELDCSDFFSFLRLAKNTFM